MLRKKKIQAMIIMIIALIIVLVGAFAWNSFTQSRINKVSVLTAPNVNLHDDFEGGPNKDVYVENSGTVPIFARIKLTEFLTTVNRGSLVEGHIDATGDNKDDIARAWAAHNAKLSNGNQGTDPHTCQIEELLGSAWPAGSNFHDYFTWLFGGDTDANAWIYYKPAPEDKKSRTAADGTYIDGEVVFDELTGTSPLGDAHLEYLALMKAEPGITDAVIASAEIEPEEAAAMEKLGLAKTLATTQVVTMNYWINTLNSVPGPYWVIDADGWCYWAQPLEGGDATGLLLDKISWSERNFDSDSDYSINVWLNAVDLTGIMDNDLDIDNTGTPEAKKLLGIISGQMVTVGDKTFAKKTDGTYVELDENGTEKATAAVIPIGAANATSFTNYNNALKVGDTFAFNPELIWDGSKYNSASTGTEPKYNLGTGTDYTIVAAVTGRDGNKYLQVEDEADNVFYIASIGDEASGYAIQPQLGMGPYTVVFVDDVSQLGSKDMKRSDPSVTTSDDRYLYHLGSGVYIEVESDGATTQIEDPDTGKYYYYFMGEILTKTSVSGKDFDQVTGSELKLAANDKMTVTFAGATTTVATITNTAGAFYFEDLVKGINGNWYIKMGDVLGDELVSSADAGYIGINATHETGKYLGQAGNIRVWAGPMGIGSTGDITTQPAIFGAGTQADPFRIMSKKEMVYISEQVAAGNLFAGKYLKVMSNIDLANTTAPTDKVYKAIGDSSKQFKGNFNGGSFEITGLTINTATNFQGLFGYVGEGGVVENVKLKGASVTGSGAVGGIAGANNSGRVVNCTVDSTSTIGGTNCIGGVVGISYLTGSVSGCTNNATITATGTSTSIGGVVGNNNTANTKIENCINNGTITATSNNYVGGVVGENRGGTVTNSSNTAAVSGNQYVGGVAGWNNGSASVVQNCYSKGNVTGASNYTGGVAGYNVGTVQESYSTGVVKGKQYVGGVTGYNALTINNCYAWGDVTSDLTTQPDLGGVAGYSKGTITKSYHAKGKLQGQHNRVGGIVGNQVGGNLQYCVAYATSITGASNIGRIIGNSSNGGTFSYCYYRNGLPVGNGGAIYDGDGVVADTQADWTNTAKFDFTNTWTWDATNKVPVLKNTPK